MRYAILFLLAMLLGPPARPQDRPAPAENEKRTSALPVKLRMEPGPYATGGPVRIAIEYCNSEPATTFLVMDYLKLPKGAEIVLAGPDGEILKPTKYFVDRHGRPMGHRGPPGHPHADEVYHIQPGECAGFGYDLADYFLFDDKPGRYTVSLKYRQEPVDRGTSFEVAAFADEQEVVVPDGAVQAAYAVRVRRPASQTRPLGREA